MVGEELLGKQQGVPEDELGHRGVQVQFHSAEESENCPGELVEPVRGGEACLQSRLEGAVEPFNKAIALWVVGHGAVMADAKGGGNSCIPLQRGDLGSSV